MLHSFFKERFVLSGCSTASRIAATSWLSAAALVAVCYGCDQNRSVLLHQIKSSTKMVIKPGKICWGI
jgi:hypothetical protein